MDNININNIFSNGSKINNHGLLDVNSLYNTQTNFEKRKIDFDINRLINAREEKKLEIINQYRKVFRVCLKKINEANRLNSTDLIFEVPRVIFGFANYDQAECMNYINKKLRMLHLDTLTLSKKSLFISWKNIKENINNSKKYKKKK